MIQLASTSINIRMDSDLKRNFEEFCEDMGMTMSTAFTIFAKKTVREYRIPFEIGAENPNAETITAIREVQELRKNPDKKKYSSFAELLEDLDE